jgi:hypothetical protein
LKKMPEKYLKPPTLQPTMVATPFPTHVSAAPTGVPTIDLSSRDDDDDSGNTAAPTLLPTFFSHAPTKQVTDSPTKEAMSPTAPPSKRPTIFQTSAPVQKPTWKPTAIPVQHPTSKTDSLAPTAPPTEAPVDPNGPCAVMWKRAQVDCADLEYHGAWCVKLCIKRLESKVEYAPERAACPIMWK